MLRRFVFILAAIGGLQLPAAAEPPGPLQFYDATKQRFQEAPGIASDIRVAIDGTIARTTVTQYFLNDSESWREGLYTYPLPDQAAVDGLTMMVGNRRIIGFVHERQEAREIYEEAKASGQAAGLIEEHRANLFRTAVANIPPRSLIAIEIRYQSEVALSDGVFAFRLPLAITPRYDRLTPDALLGLVSAGGQEWAREVVERLALTDFEGGENPVHLMVELAPGFAPERISSPSHQVTIEPEDGRYRIAPSKAIMASDRDFVLSWRLPASEEAISTMHQETMADGVYSHLLIMPPTIPSGLPTPPRQVTYVIDVSGSMDGPSIRQARAALAEALEDLAPADHFNVIAFNDRHWALFDRPLQASAENRARARAAVLALAADGGTEMLPAIAEAFAEPRVEGTLRQIVFLTDGAIGYEAELMTLIKSGIGDARVFAIGIGAAPNAHLLHSVALAGRGTSTFIGSVDQIGSELRKLFGKMRRPAITDLAVVLPEGMYAEVIPAPLPDLLAGEPISVAVYSRAPLDHFAITGVRGGEPWRLEVQAEAERPSPGVGKIFANRKIQDLEFSDPQHQDPAIRKQIVDLGIAHQVMSPFTSLVAVDEAVIRPEGAELDTKRFDPSLPAGWQADRLEGGDAALRLRAKLQDASVAPASLQQSAEVALPATGLGYVAPTMFGLLLMISGLWLMIGRRDSSGA